MKILQLIHKCQQRGAETFASQLSNHILDKGYPVKVVSLFNGNGKLPFKGMITSLQASEDKRFVDFKAWKNLSFIIKDFEPDIVQVNAGDTLKYAVFSKMLYGWKCPIVVRNASEVGRYLNSGLQKYYNRFLYRQVELVISVSKASRRDILQHFPFLKKKVEVIPIGLDMAKSVAPFNLLPPSVRHVVHVGGFTFEKNHVGLLRIFSSVLEKEREIHLHLVGDGPLKKEMEMEVKERGLESHVTFYGFVDNALDYINAAHILVLPSIIEGLPGVILEAMFCKTAVIAYDVGGISEILGPETGTLIGKHDETGFSAAILDVLHDSNEGRLKKAYEIVATEYNNDRVAAKFIASYKKLLFN